MISLLRSALWAQSFTLAPDGAESRSRYYKLKVNARALAVGKPHNAARIAVFCLPHTAHTHTRTHLYALKRSHPRTRPTQNVCATLFSILMLYIHASGVHALVHWLSTL